MFKLGFKKHNCPKITIFNSHREKNIGRKMMSLFLFIAILWAKILCVNWALIKYSLTRLYNFYDFLFLKYFSRNLSSLSAATKLIRWHWQRRAIGSNPTLTLDQTSRPQKSLTYFIYRLGTKTKKYSFSILMSWK